MNIIRKTQFTTSNWAGGTTTELRIMPDNANYKERRFDFRVSTASVELKASTFTALEGVKRHLMILSGTMTLDHVGHYQKQLGPFDQDTFDGGYKTLSTCIDTVVDFNLMLQEGWVGSLSHHALVDQVTLSGQEDGVAPLKYRDLYCVDGPLEVAVGHHRLRLFDGDYLVLQETEIEGDITVSGKGNLVEIKVWSE